MLGGLKKMLGIEGVKMELITPEEVDKSGGAISGTIQLVAKGDRIVEFVEVDLIEKYQRGRKKAKLIDEYKVGKVLIEGPFELQKGEEKTIEFEMVFSLNRSEIEVFGDKNFLFRGIAGLAKLAKGAKSSYRLEGRAKVIGTKLNPIAVRDIMLT